MADFARDFAKDFAKDFSRAKAVSIDGSQNRMKFLIVAAFAALTLATALAWSQAAKAAAAYDGSWKVVIITQSGNCDPAYSYPVKVVDGQVTYAGDGSFEISGNVAQSGGVSVAIARGDQKANASGRLTATSGSGQWTGKSSSTACSGRWEATRSS